MFAESGLTQRTLARIAAAALALVSHTSAAASAHTIQSLTLARPEGARQYLLVQPAGTHAGRRPLVILLHGHTGTAAQLLGQAQGAAPLSIWLGIADREGLLLAVPDGAKGSDGQRGWNDCRSDATSNPRNDDVGLITAIIDQAITQHQADPMRVYVMGMSNGGMMIFRLATELGQKLAAVAAVSSSMAAKSQCAAPKIPLSLLVISGDADPLVPYQGGEVRFYSQKTRGTVSGIEDAAAFYRKLDGLPGKATSTGTLPHRDANDKTRALRTVWGADPTRFQVELVRIHGGGHVEPSITQRVGILYSTVVGPQNGDFEAAEEAWAFFKDKSNVRKL